MRTKISAAGRELLYGPPPPPPEPRPEQEKYTITNCGIGWKEHRPCSGCKHCVAAPVWEYLGCPVKTECWHPSVKREKPYPHGPAIDEKREVDDGSCDKFEERG